MFNHPPTLELLQWLTRGSLKQNLARAVRLWVWLRLLYGQEGERLELPEPFTYAKWRDVFFTESHPKGEKVLYHADSRCPCRKTAASWLFAEGTGVEKPTWIRMIVRHTDWRRDAVEDWLNQPLFSLTRRMLAGDLQALTQLGWLRYRGRRYWRVQRFPSFSMVTSNQGSAEDYSFLPPDLGLMAWNHRQQVNGVQRFFLHVDYVVPRRLLDKVEDLQDQLKQLWAKTPIPPVLLRYRSAKLDGEVDCVVYPVCIYYVQRAIYLCAWGRDPYGAMNWCNYRLDRIEVIVPLEWQDGRVPESLGQRYQQQDLPTPDFIQAEMEKAWGFDYYQQPLLLLLRFDGLHNRRYIQGTVRHETFKPVSYEEAMRLVKREAPVMHRQRLLQVIQSRPGEDAYYRAIYRQGDPNVLMRLQAWRPFVEVLLPWELRVRVAEDVRKEAKLYED
ncbi:TIGR03985 family CRISPR-associated protein [Coleofasciculus sp. E1-EBD-02]|uniref:TIGR03985 family CRISPR-associated protein n=1 Tax=Coleofasciculus sp. E1-EBD-02 TaxID=3068481 RepID=UPI0032F93239